MADITVADAVLKTAQMVVTEGLGEGRPADGFCIIVGNAHEILADERDDGPDIKLCRYGRFKTYLDRRRHDLKISNCFGERKRNLLNLFNEDGAIVVDGKTGQVCCGGFIVYDLSGGISTGGARTIAASAMARKAGGCYVVLASQAICGSVKKPVPASAMLMVCNCKSEPDYVPVQTGRRERTLKQWLHPLDFDALLRQHNEYFVEGTRQWLLDDLEKWRKDSNGSRCKVLLAGAGFGKTSIAARLHQKWTRVLAIHFCCHDDSLKCDPRRMITSISYQIAEILPQFKDALRKVHEGHATDAYGLRPTVRQLADCLLFEPLTKIAQPQCSGEDGRYIIIIDAPDEAARNSRHDLLALISVDFHKFPAWVAMLITARPEAEIMKTLARLCPTMLDNEEYKDNIKSDVRVYLERILAPRITDEGRLDKVIDKITTKSEGLFLYLHYVREMLIQGNGVDELPPGLDGFYQAELQSLLGSEGLGDENSEARRVVEAIVATQVPALHVHNELPGFSGVGKKEVVRLVKRLSRLLPVRDKHMYIFHKSFVAWLTGDDGFDRSLDEHNFYVDRCAAHRRLALVCAVHVIGLLRENKRNRFDSDEEAIKALKKFLKAHGSRVYLSRRSPSFDAYALRWSVTHLVEAGKFKQVALSLLHSLGFLVKRAPQIDTLITDAMLLPEADSVYRALLLAQNHVRSVRPHWLAEELWQRLLRPATMSRVVRLKRLAEDARKMARASLMFSARQAYLTPADSYLHCVLEGHDLDVTAVTTFDANGHAWLASSSIDKTVRIWNPMRGGNAIHLMGHSDQVNGVTAFEDADCRSWVASFSSDTVHIWDPIKGDLIRILRGHRGMINGVTACVDTNRHTWLASCSDDNSVRIWNAMEDGAALRVLHGHKLAVLDVVFVRADGHTSVVSCSFDTTVRVWDLINDRKPVRQDALDDFNAVRVLEGHSDSVRGVTAFFGANGITLVASCSDDKTVRIWDPIKDGEAVYVLEGHSDWVPGVTAFVNPGYTWLLASCSQGKKVCIWGAMNHGKVHKLLEGHSERVEGATDNEVRIWDALNRSKSAHMLEGHFERVNGLAAFTDTNDRAWVASCSSDKTVRFWNSMRRTPEVRALECHTGKVNGVTAFTDSKGHTLVASCSDDKTVRLWDPIMGAEAVQVLESHSREVKCVAAFEIDSHPLLATSSGNEIRIWDAHNFVQSPRTRDNHTGSVNGVTAFVDGNGNTWLASCSADMTVRIWDAVNDGEPVHVLNGHKDVVRSVVAFKDTNDETWVVSCSDDKTVRIWDAINGGNAKLVLAGHEGIVNGTAAFVDGNCTWVVASASDDTTVRIWDAIHGGSPTLVLMGHSAPVNGVTSVDAQGSNKWLASCSNDSTVRIWDATNGGEAYFVIPLDGPSTAILTISAAPAQARDVREATSLLACGHKNGQVTFWEYMQGGSTQRSLSFL